MCHACVCVLEYVCTRVTAPYNTCKPCTTSYETPDYGTLHLLDLQYSYIYPLLWRREAPARPYPHGLGPG